MESIYQAYLPNCCGEINGPQQPFGDNEDLHARFR